MHYILSLLLSLSFLHSLLCSNEEIEKNKTILAISDGDFEINTINITYLNNKKPNSEIASSGKIWHLNADKDFKDIFLYIKLTQYFMLLVDKTELLLQLTENSLAPFNIIGVIIPNNTLFNSLAVNELISTSPYSIFMYNDTNIDYLLQYDIKTEKSNHFFHVSYRTTIFVIPFAYLKTLSIVSFILSCGIVVLWTLKQRYTPPTDIILIQKILLVLPYLNIILSALMIVEMFLTTGSNSNNFLDSRIYVETALVTIRAIFRTIIWFLLVLIASGWQIISNALSSEKIKTFIKVYVFIYIVVCVDQIIDAFVGSIFLIFYPSEIKNIFFYLLMAIGIAYEGMKTVKMIKNKLLYASTLSPEFIPSLVLKKHMMIYHIGYAIGYFVVYSILLIIHKVALTEYNVQDFLLINYHVLDIIFLSLYLVLYRPRKLPPYFNVDFGEDEVIDFGNIYSAKIPNIQDVIDIDKRIQLNPEVIAQLNKNKNANNEKQFPIVLINPVTINNNINEEKKTINLIIDKLSIGFLSN